jgi:hypothetical protein
MRRIAILVAMAALMSIFTVPTASADNRHSDFYGVYFPAGMPGTGTDCPYTWVDPAFCVIDPGDWTELPSGKLRIRGMTVYELALSWNDHGVEPRKTGYDVVVANANLDESLSGPTWGTWQLHSNDGTLMFRGTFTGKFEAGIPAVHFVGRGVGDYAGELMRGDIGREISESNPYNMFGEVVVPGSA